MSIANDEDCFTFTWVIENFSILLNSESRRMKSTGKMDARENSHKWELILHILTNKDVRFEVYCLTQNLCLDRCDMSMISAYEEVSLQRVSERTFVIERNVLLGANDELNLSSDTLTVRCRMWKFKTGEICVRSVLHKVNLDIETFDLSKFYNNTFLVKGDLLLYIIMVKSIALVALGGTHTVIIGGTPIKECHYTLYECKLSINEDHGRILSSRFSSPTSSEWLRYIRIFDGNNKGRKFQLQLECIVAIHNNTALRTSSPERVNNTDSCVPVAVQDFPGTLSNALLQLLREKTLSDATLNTEGKSFSAHRSILAARSPVFRAMFEKDQMSEGRSGVVDIDDVDSETVDRLLVFLYGDSIKNLKWKEASALYYAADKYDIQPLKEKCSDILKTGLAVSNACEAIALADKHSDDQLMKSAVDFILDHEAVVSSTEWEKLEESNPRLTSKILRELFVKKGKK